MIGQRLGEPFPFQKQVIQARQKFGTRPPVGGQRQFLSAVLGLHFPNRGQVSGQIGAAELEDGLLGIADHEEPAFAAVEKQPAKDAPLQGIGVLKFIDDGVVIALPQDGEQMRGAWIFGRVQALVHAAEHVFEADQPALALVFGQEALQV